MWTDLSHNGSNHLQSFIISNPFSILVNIKQLKEFNKKQKKKEQYENKEDARASTTHGVEDVKIEPMDIDEDKLIPVSRKRILEEQARELQEEQVRLENKYSEIQEEVGTYLILYSWKFYIYTCMQVLFLIEVS